MKTYLHLICFFVLIGSAFGSEKNPVPRFVSLKSKEVNARVGPGPNYPVEWIYIKAGLPIEVIAEFDTWRKIRDIDGTESWVHQNMLSFKRYAIVQNSEILMYPQETTTSVPLVRLQKGVIVELLKCRNEWCQVSTPDFKGWVQRASLWGHYPQEWLG
jgi:SH3-like domain-containing protein